MEIFKKPGLVDETLGKLGKPYSIYCLIMDGLILNQMMLRNVVKYEFQVSKKSATFVTKKYIP
jgi:hypothetical protein